MYCILTTTPSPFSHTHSGFWKVCFWQQRDIVCKVYRVMLWRTTVSMPATLSLARVRFNKTHFFGAPEPEKVVNKKCELVVNYSVGGIKFSYSCRRWNMHILCMDTEWGGRKHIIHMWQQPFQNNRVWQRGKLGWTEQIGWRQKILNWKWTLND